MGDQERQRQHDQEILERQIGHLHQGTTYRRRLIPADFTAALQQYYDENNGERMLPGELAARSHTLSKTINRIKAAKYLSQWKPQTTKPTQSSLPTSQAQAARARLEKKWSREQAQQALRQQRLDRAQAISDQGAADAAATAQWRVNNPEEWRAIQADNREKQRQHDQEIAERQIPHLHQDTY